MKEITEYKELTPEEAKKLEWPVENCSFSDVPEDAFFRSSLTGLKYLKGIGSYRFIDEGGMDWDRCIRLIKRSPRAVPDDVLPLPDDKPFLAYLGKGSELLSDIWEGYYWSIGRSGFWCGGSTGGHNNRHYAINVSTYLAAKYYPELIEAMEYEKVYAGHGNQHHIGHRLGNKLYDLGWKEIKEQPENEDSGLAGSESNHQHEN